MKVKSSKIICFSISLIFFGLSQVTEALSYSNGIQIHNETNELISKEGGGGKKSGGKKSGGKKKWREEKWG